MDVKEDFTDTPKFIRLTQLPKLKWLPPRKDGKKLHVSTPYRWAQRGINGIKLRTVQVGGTKCTTEQWLLEFFETLSRRDPSQTTFPSANAQQAGQASRELHQLLYPKSARQDAVEG